MEHFTLSVCELSENESTIVVVVVLMVIIAEYLS